MGLRSYRASRCTRATLGPRMAPRSFPWSRSMEVEIWAASSRTVLLRKRAGKLEVSPASACDEREFRGGHTILTNLSRPLVVVVLDLKTTIHKVLEDCRGWT